MTKKELTPEEIRAIRKIIGKESRLSQELEFRLNNYDELINTVQRKVDGLYESNRLRSLNPILGPSEQTIHIRKKTYDEFIILKDFFDNVKNI